MLQIKPPMLKFVHSLPMNRIIIILALTLPIFQAHGQYQFRRVASLPTDLNEISGLQYLNGQILAHNDGGNPPELFGIDTFGNIVWKKKVLGSNIDWEGIALKRDSFIFIADFGNNDNNRKDLKIYKISLRDLDGDTLKPEIINFFYPEQKNFPPAETDLYYDCEAIIYFNDSLHLFTKNRTSPFDGWVKHYCLPAVSGKHAALLKDSLQIGSLVKELYWITGADVSPNAKKLALQSTDKVFLFSNFGESNFLQGHPETFVLGDISQKEAITFINDSLLLIADEANVNWAGIYLLTLPPQRVGTEEDPEVKQLTFAYDTNSETLRFNTIYNGQLHIYDQNGKRLVYQPMIINSEKLVSTKGWTIGAYRFVFITRKERFQAIFLKF